MPISDYLKNLRRHVGTAPIMMPAVIGVVTNQRDEILLTRPRDDQGNWYRVGGARDPHEQPADAIEREVFEETGVGCRAVRILGVYAEPPITYANGDVVLYVTTAFLCRALESSHQPRPRDDELVEAKFVAPETIRVAKESHRRSIELAMGDQLAADFLRDRAT